MTTPAYHTAACNRVRKLLSQLGCFNPVLRTPGTFRQRSTETLVAINQPGEADVQAVHRATGRLVAVEVKTGNATRTPLQRRWAAAAEQAGVIYILAHFRSPDDTAPLTHIRAVIAAAQEQAA